METTGTDRFGSKGFSAYLARQAPLSAVDVRRTRALVIGFPVLAVLAVLGFGVSAGRAVDAVVFFALWVGIQMLLLSPARRRQVLGLPEAQSAEG
jgi:hypothetical protein